MQESNIFSIPGFAEPVSSLSHLAGAVVFAILSVFLLRRGKLSGGVVSLGIFASTCIFLLTLSAIYHLTTPGGGPHHVFQRLDHAAIFAFIAGTFTPIHTFLFSGFLRWGMLAIIWGIAATGITLKAALFTAVPEAISLGMYLGLGWLGLVAGVSLWRRHGFDFIKPLLVGGLAYTAGSILEFSGYPVLLPGVIGPHELFHFAVLAGIACHWRFIHNAMGLSGKFRACLRMNRLFRPFDSLRYKERSGLDCRKCVNPCDAAHRSARRVRPRDKVHRLMTAEGDQGSKPTVRLK